jgi:hypothetical protein
LVEFDDDLEGSQKNAQDIWFFFAVNGFALFISFWEAGTATDSVSLYLAITMANLSYGLALGIGVDRRLVHSSGYSWTTFHLLWLRLILFVVDNFGCWMVAALEKCRACSLQGKVVGSGFARAGPRCSRNLQLSLVALFSAGVASRAALLYCMLLLSLFFFSISWMEWSFVVVLPLGGLLVLPPGGLLVLPAGGLSKGRRGPLVVPPTIEGLSK